MNKTLKKLISTVLIMLCLFNFFYTNYVPVYATNKAATVVNGTLQAIVNTMVNLLGGVVGLFTLPFRILAMGIGLGINILTAQVAYMDGTTKGADVDIGETIVITPFEIFFNKIQILDVNFLDLSISGKTTKTFRTAVAEWYYIMRLVAVSILLLILIYVGIRMAISTVASEKAMYKKSLVDWVTSLALVFLLQYIIMFTVHANAAIIAALESVVKGTKIEEKILGIALISLGISLESMASTAIYVIFVIQVLMFVLKYIKRMLTVAFLIIISPLISITYSIDKMGDGKAQALNTWLKEFVYNVLIQPFHCIIYMAFIGTAFNLLTGGGDSVLKGIAQLLPGLGSSDLANAVLAIMCMLFVDDAEKIVKKIFGFDAASSLSSNLSTLALAGAVAKGGQKAVGAAQGLRKSINTAKEKGIFAAVKKDVINFKDRKQIADRAKEIAATGKDSKTAKKEAQRENFENYEKDRAKKKGKKTYKKKEKAEEKKKKREKIEKEKREDSIDSAMEKDFSKEEIDRMHKNGTYDSTREKYAKKYDEKAKKKDEKKQKINNFVGNVKNSNVAKYYKENSAALGLGIFTGIAGGMANPLAGVAAGMAVKKGASEFFKTSRQNLVEDASKHVREDTNVQKVFQDGNNGDFDKDSEKMKQLMDEVKKALEKMGTDGKVNGVDISTLTSQIQRDINYQKQVNPEGFNLDSILKKAVGNQYDNPELQEKAKKLENFEDDKILYSYLQKGSELGMPITEFENGLEGTISSEKHVTVDNVFKHLNTNKEITEIVSKVDESEARAIIKEIENALNNYSDSLTGKQTRRYNEMITELNNKINTNMPTPNP